MHALTAGLTTGSPIKVEVPNTDQRGNVSMVFTFLTLSLYQIQQESEIGDLVLK